MKTLWRVYARSMKVHWAILLEYRGDTLFYMIGSFIYPLVTLAVWLAISAGGEVGGYGQRDFILYFLAVLFVARLNGAWDTWEIETMMREGTLSSYLLRPSAFIHWRIAENLVYKLLYGVLMLAAWMIAWPFTDVVHISLDPGFLAVVIVAILLASVIAYMFQYCLAMLGFWTTRMLAIVNLMEAVGLFLSGRIAPYSFLPDWVQATQSFTPFYWLLGFPVDVITGRVSGPAVWSGLGLQVFWAVLFIALYFVLWHRGLRKYSAVGG
ncbi:ABC-2 family transporter protein [Tumebacillus sp. DT12]|uniref:ABC-2 family transporter protein n=1 Tax=Tumebacillus lacus TaxID=2995335 RepID=A0ABT3X5F2_9BACL|nr:ABC-2 family transporter protein [Tumebacillus lacus]MCX7572130.1 ABC-2 family transporter protein [Tumebacillus lacus]